MHFLDSSTLPPNPTVGETLTINPDFTRWKRQDRLIYSGLIGSITESIQPLVSTCKTSADIWNTLAVTYNKPSRGHIQQLKLQLKQWVKGTKTIDEYVQGFVTRFDQLASLRKPIDKEDQLEYILGVLPEEYKTITDQLEGRDTTPSVTEVHEKLLNKEARFLTLAAPTLPLPVTANTAMHATSNRQQHTPRPNQNWNKNHQTSRYTNNRENRNSREYPNGYQHNQQGGYQSNYQGGYQGKCKFCGLHGHSARRCPQLGGCNNTQNTKSSYTPWQPRANMALTSPDTAWLLDSRATHHMTSDLSNLSIHQPYRGDDDVLIGDGSGLSITHT